MKTTYSYKEIENVKFKLIDLVSKLEGNSAAITYLDPLKSEIKHYDVLLAELGENNLLTDSGYVAGLYETEKLIESIYEAVK
ncbi:hypothetical protein NXZ75_13835 [Lysinibacillus sphaericus]|uniref:hypothetical protein n=1 Tax=Lysinibacillus sphaericus TaxID=1421 RepID=UPI002163AE57|nr:hypothetical protein [Lysinibacillus sphaericus]MCS1383283.1 hypothetical protein [Lysinibacillus sphaericus]